MTDLRHSTDPHTAKFSQRMITGVVVDLQRSSAEAVLKELQLQPDAWTKVDSILERSTTEQTKFFALQVSLQT